MSVKERLKEYLEYKGISVNAFETTTGMSKGYYRNTKHISADVLSRICTTYEDISAEWILRGVGTMLKAGDNNQIVVNGDSSVAAMNSSVSTAAGQLVDSLKREIELKDQVIEEKERLIKILLADRS